MSFYDARLNRDPAMAEPERRMWAAVLANGIREALGFAVRRGGGRHERGRGESARVVETNLRQARAWIGSRDFRQVCALVGVCPGRGKTAVRRLIVEADAGRLRPEDLGLQVRSVIHGLKGPRPGGGR